MNRNFCSAPWVNIHLHPTGSLRPCCVSTDSWGEFTGSHTSIAQAYESEEAQKIRSQFLKGETPQGCSKCFEKEAAGVNSVRHDINRNFDASNKLLLAEAKTSELQRLDVSFSNQCNMNCRFCGPYCSTKWIENAKSLPIDTDGFWDVYKSDRWKPYNVLAKDLFAEAVQLPLLKEIEIKGGEPFLSNEHLLFLNLLIESGKSKNIDLLYTTNGSVIREDLKNCFKEFNSVHISFSMEAIGPMYSYIRSAQGSEEKTLKAIRFYGELPNITTSIHYTLCAINIFSIEEFLNWYEKTVPQDKVPLTLGLLVDPIFLSVDALPTNIKLAALGKLSSKNSSVRERIANILKRPQGSDQTQSFWRFIDTLDEIQGASLCKVAPEFKDFRTR